MTISNIVVRNEGQGQVQGCVYDQWVSVGYIPSVCAFLRLVAHATDRLSRIRVRVIIELGPTFNPLPFQEFSSFKDISVVIIYLFHCFLRTFQ